MNAEPIEEDEEEEEAIDINAPCLPDALREHGQRFKKRLVG